MRRGWQKNAGWEWSGVACNSILLEEPALGGLGRAHRRCRANMPSGMKQPPFFDKEGPLSTWARGLVLLCSFCARNDLPSL